VSDIYRTITVAGLGVFSAAALLYALLWLRPNALLRRAALLFMFAGLALNVAFLILRWQEAGRPPFKSLYESLILLGACISLVYIVVEIVYRIRALGVLAAAGSTGIILYAYFNIDKEIVNLPAALQSVWFIPHVVVYFFGYASMFVAFIAAILYLVHPRPFEHRRLDLVGAEAVDMERFADGTMRFGFVLLTAGLLMGAFWAQSAWGDYWSWDPKETWSLVSWTIFVIVLHLRHVSEWKGRRFAVLLIVGFAAVMFTYLGMNLLPGADQSLHTYQ
jgi:cytochrome c-type biogenesis protein CcsB